MLSGSADIANKCRRDQMVMVIQKDYKVAHDKVRAMVIEHNALHRIKSVFAKH